MSLACEELDYQRTPLGELILRRRREPLLKGKDVFEVKLGDEFLMSSLFTEGEIALADLGLAGLEAPELDVAIGGLGLGYTADAVLQHQSVRSLLVIEALDEVIGWHRRGLVPLGAKLTADPRCKFVKGDFFALMNPPGRGFDHRIPGRRYHAVLLDIDHSPRRFLHPQNRAFYGRTGLRHLANYLHAGGAFAVWSDDPPDDDFRRALDSVFASSQVHVVKFHNLYTQGESANTVYVARTAATLNRETEALAGKWGSIIA